MTPTAPTSELGAVTRGTLGGLANWIVSYGGTEQYEHVPELVYPQSLDAYLEMTRSTHVASLIAANFNPILGFTPYLDPEGADEELTANLAVDYGIAVGEDGKPEPRRSAGRFSLLDHLEQALKAPSTYGHAAFEQVARIEQGGKRDGWVALRKLAPRPQRTIAGWLVAEDGGLVGLQQSNPRTGQVQEIPVDRLVVYVHNQEPGSWIGEPMIRPLWGAWFQSQLAFRQDSIKQDRNGSGVPVARLKEGATPSNEAQAQALAVMTAFRVGDTAGLVETKDYTFELVGVSGSTSDPIDSALKHEQRMSNAMLAQLTMVGQQSYSTTGSSDNFADLLAMGRAALVNRFARTFRAHVIEDHVDWQGDPEAAAPVLKFKTTDPEEQIRALAYAVEKKLVTVDEPVEDYTRQFLGLPERAPVEPAAPVVLPPVGGTPFPAPDAGVQVEAAATGEPGAFTRDPSPVEIQAAVDFPALTERWRRQAKRLAEQVSGERRTAAQRLAGQVADLFAAGDVEGARALTAPAVGAGLMSAAFTKAVDEGAADHVKEARTQGAKAAALDLAAAKQTAGKRAEFVAGQLGSELLGSALKAADRAFGPAATAGSIAQVVTSSLAALSDAIVVAETSAGVVASTGEGRVAAMQAIPDAARYYASELMDGSTCGSCETVDEQEYDSLEDALADYPSGAQYVGCEGGSNCRGLLVAVYEETAPTLNEPGD